MSQWYKSVVEEEELSRRKVESLLSGYISEVINPFSTYKLDFQGGTCTVIYKVIAPYKPVIDRVKLLGLTSELSRYNQEAFNNHIHNALHGVSLYEERNKSHMGVETLKDQTDRAIEKGELWGRFLAAICPSLPADIMYDMCMELSELYHFDHLRVGVAFSNAVKNKIDAYQDANRRKALPQYGQQEVRESFSNEG